MDKRLFKYNLKLMNLIMLTIYWLTAISALIYNVYTGSRYHILLALVALAISGVPAILFKLIKKPFIYEATFLFYVFTYFAMVIGSAFRGYEYFPALDKIMHFLSGFLFSIVGIALFYHLKADKTIVKSDAVLGTVFSQAVNLSVACIWEIYEYTVSVVAGVDVQHALTTGVNDTMQDMLVCAAGGAFMVYFIYQYIKNKKPSFLMNLFKSYYDNIIV